MLTYLNHYGAALHALAPIIVVGLAILGAAVLAFNGGIVLWVLVDQALLHIRPKREATCSLDDLMDGDDWARANGYAVPAVDEPWLFTAPEFKVAGPERTEAVLFAASVLADIDDIDEWTGGGDAA